MLSPCGPGCDPHLAAAVVCYLSFFISGCSFFLYWYWLANYRDEQDPLECRYPDPDSDCETLEPEPVDVNVPDDDEHEIEDTEPSAARCPTINIDVDINVQEENASSSKSNPNQNHNQNHNNPGEITIAIAVDGDEGESSNLTKSPYNNRSQNQNQHLPSDNLDSILSSSSNNNDNDNDIGQEEQQQHESHTNCDNLEEDPEDNQQGKSALSDNPYLNGNTYSHNVLWGLHGIFTNLIEAVLAAVFYSGLFENNVTTAMIWLIGFSINFLLGNLLYVLLLVYCTDKAKMKQLRLRWALESTFNILKDLYYIWIGAALLDHLFLQMKSQ